MDPATAREEDRFVEYVRYVLAVWFVASFGSSVVIGRMLAGRDRIIV